LIIPRINGQHYNIRGITNVKNRIGTDHTNAVELDVPGRITGWPPKGDYHIAGRRDDAVRLAQARQQENSEQNRKAVAKHGN